MRGLVILPMLLIAACAADDTIASDHRTCRDRGLTAGSQPYANCVAEISQRRLRIWQHIDDRLDQSH